MAPIDDSTQRLIKRAYYYDNGYRNRTYRPWWLVFAIGVPLLMLVFLIFARRTNIKRRRQGTAPIPFTGWTTAGQLHPQQQQQQQYQQPYQTYAQQPNSGGYYAKSDETDTAPPPAYQRPPGPPPGHNTQDNINNDTYPAPEGPPPGQTNYPSYPSEAYKR